MAFHPHKYLLHKDLCFKYGWILIYHGHSTEINASKIGEKLTVFQNVTIGTNGSPKGPTIGNNVLIGAGAVVIGNIKIGDNVRIGANATVVKDVPSNTTVVPASSRLINI